MPSPTKEYDVLDLFFNYPSKHLHFNEIKKSINISDSKLMKWLFKFLKEKLIIKVKPSGKMPYYISNYESSNYQNTKRIVALQKLHKSGFLNHLLDLNNVKTIIIFGSFANGDWHNFSDIDVFIYGDSSGFELGKYELKLNRDIQLFEVQTKKQIKKLGSRLMKNILRGNVIKGDLSFLEVN